MALLACGGLAPQPINTPGDRLGDALDLSDFTAPTLDAQFRQIPAFSGHTRKSPPRALDDPGFVWSAGYVHGGHSPGVPAYVPPGAPAPGFSWLPSELAIYPNNDAIRASGNSPFSVAGQAMQITASAMPAAMRGLIPANYASGYLSGAINSYPFSQTYGYFEMQARIPRGRGLWPAFWLLPVDLAWPPEIDVMEVLGQTPGDLYTTIHSRKLASGSMIGYDTWVADLSAGFHRYGVDWGPSRIAFYLDRRLVFTQPTPPDMHRPFYLLANLAVGGPTSWPGPPDAATVFPAVFQISAIRVWQRRAYLRILPPGAPLP